MSEGGPVPKPEEALPEGAGEPGAAAPTPAHAVTLQPSGWRYGCAEGDTVLRAAIKAGIRLPSSCRNGTCRSCLCFMAEGSVRYLVERPGLSSDEKAEGWILPCVAAPESDLVLDVPNARVLMHRPRPADMLTGARRA